MHCHLGLVVRDRLIVDELASVTVGTIEVLVILLAELSLVVFGNMDFLQQFMSAMSEGTIVIELAEASLLPVFANFSFVLHSEAFDVLVHLFFGGELLLSSIYGTNVLTNIPS